MQITFIEDKKKIVSIIFPDNANVFNIGDEVDLTASKQFKFKVTKRTYIAYFPYPKDTDLGKPNSFGWELEVERLTQQNATDQ